MARSPSRTPWRFVLLGALGISVVVAPQTANADQPRTGCPPGFNLGAFDFEALLGLPRIQTGLGDNIYTVEELETTFTTIDKNGDGEICLKESVGSEQANPASGWIYLYLGTDNNASNP
jgi:hypothetical protein